MMMMAKNMDEDKIKKNNPRRENFDDCNILDLIFFSLFPKI